MTYKSTGLYINRTVWVLMEHWVNSWTRWVYTIVRHVQVSRDKLTPRERIHFVPRGSMLVLHMTAHACILWSTQDFPTSGFIYAYEVPSMYVNETDIFLRFIYKLVIHAWYTINIQMLLEHLMVLCMHNKIAFTSIRCGFTQRLAYGNSFQMGPCLEAMLCKVVPFLWVRLWQGFTQVVQWLTKIYKQVCIPMGLHAFGCMLMEHWVNSWSMWTGMNGVLIEQ